MRKILIIIATIGILALATGCNKHGYKTVPCPRFHHISLNIGR